MLVRLWTLESVKKQWELNTDSIDENVKVIMERGVIKPSFLNVTTKSLISNIMPAVMWCWEHRVELTNDFAGKLPDGWREVRNTAVPYGIELSSNGDWQVPIGVVSIPASEELKLAGYTHTEFPELGREIKQNG